MAQEESLAACSNLYLTQIKTENSKYYETNRQCGTALYTDCMIYSKDVVFIRDGEYTLVKPFTANILTAPAVNMSVYLSRNEGSQDTANTVMKNRMRKVLQVFTENGDSILVLGAYGCGVFRNDPYTVGRLFRELLKDEGLENYFDEVVFAVLDTSKDKRIFNEFKRSFEIFYNYEKIILFHQLNIDSDV